jgi:hypothetical protein
MHKEGGDAAFCLVAVSGTWMLAAASNTDRGGG